MRLVTTKINKTWHEENRMPRNAGVAQRVAWHLEHAKNCFCRSVPVKLLAEMNKINDKKRNRSIQVPNSL